MRRAAIFLFVLSCGGAKTPAPIAAAGSARDAGPSATTSVLPPLGPLKAAVKGSAFVTLTHEVKLEQCHRPVRGTGRDLPKDANALGEACAKVSGAVRLSGPHKFTIGDTSPAETFRFHADNGHCYRIVLATSPELRAISVTWQDSQSAMIVDGSTDVVPNDALACFSADQDVQILFGAGIGKGEVVFELWRK